jgi:hypothetical protein
LRICFLAALALALLKGAARRLIIERDARQKAGPCRAARDK